MKQFPYTEFIRGIEIDFESEHQATVWSEVTGLGLVVSSDEDVRPLVMFLIGVDSIHVYASRYLEDTTEIDLSMVG